MILYSTINNLHVSLWKFPQLFHNSHIAQVLLNDDLIKIVTSISVLLQTRLVVGSPIPISQEPQLPRRHGVFVDPVDQPLDDTKLDEPPHIHKVEHGEALVHMHLQPLLDSARSAQRCEQSAEVEIWEARAVDIHVICTFILHVISVFHEIVEFRCWRVDVAKEEEIHHKNRVVVNEVLQGDFREVRSDVSCGGDATHIFDAVNLVDNSEKGKIPGIVFDRIEVRLGDWDLVEVDWRWMRMEGKELHIDGVGIIWSCQLAILNLINSITHQRVSCIHYNYSNLP